MALIHGGDWAGDRQKYGRDVLDFSANVSPLGTPDGVKKAIRLAAEDAAKYPDPLCRELCAAIAEQENLSPQWVLCGNGAADLIFRLVLAVRPRKALVLAPTFAEYEAALSLVSCEAVRHPLREEENFRVTEKILPAIQPDMDMVFLCQPNNPTGQAAEFPLLEQIMRRCAECGALLVVDECFLDFVPQAASLTAKPFLPQMPGLFILKAFTKLYGMAGVRLGYGLCSDVSLLEKMRLAGQPWSVSNLAQAAGLAALKETKYKEDVLCLIEQQRPLLQRQLTELGFKVIPGCTNYLLFRAFASLGEQAAQRGVVLRSCGNYEGLDENWYRTAVRTEAENRKLIKTLREVCV